MDDINQTQSTNAPTQINQPLEPWNISRNTTISSADIPNPQLTPESTPGETARIHAALSHPYFSNHPTQTSASGVGDIVIDNRPKKTRLALSRSKAISIIIAAVGVVVVGVLVALVATKRNSDISTTTSYQEFATSAERKFNQYANYILYGKKEDILSGQYSIRDTYELTTQFEKDKPENDFWNEANKLLGEAISNFEAVVSINSDPVNDNLLNNLQQYQQRFLFLVNYPKMLKLSDSKIYQTYKNDGESATRALIEEFSAQNIYNNPEVQLYFDQKNSEYTTMFDYFEKFTDAGCLSEDGVNLECPIFVLSSEEIFNTSAAINSYQYEAEETLHKIVADIEENCWSISQQLSEISGEANEK